MTIINLIFAFVAVLALGILIVYTLVRWIVWCGDNLLLVSRFILLFLVGLCFIWALTAIVLEIIHVIGG